MGVRWKMGTDVWECTCGAIVPMGQFCRNCGNDYGNVLAENAERKESKQKKQSKRFRSPADEGEFTTSFFFKDKNKGDK